VDIRVCRCIQYLSVQNYLFSELYALSITVLCVLLLLFLEREDKRTAFKCQSKTNDLHQVSSLLTGFELDWSIFKAQVANLDQPGLGVCLQTCPPSPSCSKER